MDQRIIGSGDAVRPLNRLFIQALKALRDKGEGDLACRLAAQAWLVLRDGEADEADRLTAALHVLTRNH